MAFVNPSNGAQLFQGHRPAAPRPLQQTGQQHTGSTVESQQQHQQNQQYQQQQHPKFQHQATPVGDAHPQPQGHASQAHSTTHQQQQLMQQHRDLSTSHGSVSATHPDSSSPLSLQSRDEKLVSIRHHYLPKMTGKHPKGCGNVDMPDFLCRPAPSLSNS